MVPCPAAWWGEFFLYVENILVYRLLVPVLERDETAQTTLEVERHGRRVHSELTQIENILRLDASGLTQVEYGDAKVLHEIGLLTHVRDDGIPVQFTVREDRRVGLEGDDSAMEIGRTDFLYFARRLAAVFVILPLHAAFTVHLGAHVRRQGVHDRDTDAVQAARDFVAVAAEFASRVEDRHHSLQGRDLGLGVDLDGNATTVVGDAHAIARQKRYLDVIAEPAHRFVARVIEDFPNEVVKAGRTGRADVHAGATSHRLHSLKDGNVFGRV